MTRSKVICTMLEVATFSVAVAAPASQCPAAQMCGEAILDLAAFAAELSAPRPDRISENPFYIAVRDRSKFIIWTVTKPGHPAHPAIVCRKPAELDAEVLMHMDVSCGGPKPACDTLVAEFKALNDEATKSMRGKADGTGKK